VEGRFDLRPDVEYPHLGATTLPNLGAKLHLGAIRNELAVHCRHKKRGKMFKNRTVHFQHLNNNIIFVKGGNRDEK